VTRYALLIAPSSNRVYADASVRMMGAELRVFADTALSAKVREIGAMSLAGVPYVGFETDAPLDARDLDHVANLSSLYALFEIVDDELLRPVRTHPLAAFDDDLLTIQKYSGKTNEQFTKLLLNVTLLASTHAPRMLDGRLLVLDPLAGRGTTCNQALMYGYDTIGIDTDGKDFDIYSSFIRTWLKRKRLKHKAEITPVRKDKKLLARRLSVSIGGTQQLTMYHADSIQAREFLKGGVADVIVTDLPYGVSHGSRAEGSLSRSPLRLLEQAVPVWATLLQPGGALGMSWNTHVASRDEAAEILESNGLRVKTGPGYDDFAHWVDQSIDRDVIVARRY
jgi:hypothetical protein